MRGGSGQALRRLVDDVRSRPLGEVARLLGYRRVPTDRFDSIAVDPVWSAANRAISLLCPTCRRSLWAVPGCRHSGVPHRSRVSRASGAFGRRLRGRRDARRRGLRPGPGQPACADDQPDGMTDPADKQYRYGVRHQPYGPQVVPE